jgi:lipid II:glycine glycyltransferase (peptidoglycan interpeptide bridge formation enzyme)
MVTQEEWNEFQEQFPQAHILQDSAWGALKEAYDWQARYIIKGDLGAQVLLKPLPLGFCVAYLPRGPVSAHPQPWETGGWTAFLEELDDLCRRERAVFLKMEPDDWESKGEDSPVPPPGFRSSSHDIQPPRTIVVDLTAEEDEILGRMKSKTRYNIRLSKRKDVQVREAEDVETFYRLLAATADRADFGVHEKAYYQRAYDLFVPQGKARLFLAEYEGQPLAGILVFARGERSWYFYGASSSEHRDRMPTYLVQWEAMRWAKNRGCRSYDLWGVPDYDFEALEDQFLDRSDGLWGVYRFKRGFGGELKRAQGPWDRVYRPLLYRLYRLRVAGEEH